MLTDLHVRRAKPADKEYKLADSGGLFLLVKPSGYRSWRLKYRFGKQEKLLTFGSYVPERCQGLTSGANDLAPAGVIFSI